MSQHDYDIANGSGATVRADLNLALAAIATNNSGATAPSTTFANQWWFDETTNLMKQRDEANTAWITVAEKTATDWNLYQGTVALTAAVMAWTANHTFGKQVILSGTLSPAQITANQNDYNPASLADALALRLNSDASRNVTGLSGGADGRVVTITNVGSFDIVLTSEDAASSAANRFLIAGGDMVLGADDVVALRYDGTSSRWRPLHATAHGQQTIFIPASAMVARSTSGAADGSAETTTNKVMIETKDFDAAADEFVQFQVLMPKGWDGGTLIAQFVWSHAAATTYGVRFFIQAVALADGDAADTAFGTAVGHTADAGGTTDDIYITPETGEITVAGSPGAEEYVVFQVYRDVSDAGDTLDVDARLHGVKIHYTTRKPTDD